MALGGGSGGAAAEAEEIGGVKFEGRVLDGFDSKGLRGAVDEAKQRLGSGVAALVAVNDGRATVAVGVTDDLVARFSAVDLVKAGVAAVGGQGGGGRPDMAQGGGPDGAKAERRWRRFAVRWQMHSPRRRWRLAADHLSHCSQNEILSVFREVAASCAVSKV